MDRKVQLGKTHKKQKPTVLKNMQALDQKTKKRKQER